MIEQQIINDKEVWLKIDPHPIERANPNIIPNEYFTASYFLSDPDGDNAIGILMKDDEGAVKMFESPVAALSYASKKMEETL